ncbi:MAG: SGNH/GDSL hydrolase family protein, partial [Nitrospirales bacterium]|nr:SGNH/GDSL hydrolase family protein [Nitrospirales bacterium]
MIFAGNSNITCFNQQGLEATSTGEPVSVHWVGALQIDHFFNGHPAGARVRELFGREKGWKFLSIGTHDIFGLCRAASKGELEKYLPRMQELYKGLFSELQSGGSFGWLVFPQPLNQLSFPGLSAADILKVAKRFNEMVKIICKEEGIPVIAPLAQIVDRNGNPLKEFVQGDGIHLNLRGAEVYLQEVSALTGAEISFRPGDLPFEPASEVESFCSLLLDELKVPRKAGITSSDFMASLSAFIAAQLRDRGLDLEIGAETELVDSGLLDSLSLVETYTYATGLLGLEIPFDVNLRDLHTLSKLEGFLFRKMDEAGRSTDPLSQEAFILSLRGDWNDEQQREQILEADRLISGMDDSLFRAFQEQVTVVSHGVPIRYGIILFWVALNKAARGDYTGALEHLDAAADRSR